MGLTPQIFPIEQSRSLLQGCGGMSTTSIALDTYADMLPGMQDGAVEALGTLLFGPETV